MLMGQFKVSEKRVDHRPADAVVTPLLQLYFFLTLSNGGVKSVTNGLFKSLTFKVISLITLPLFLPNTAWISIGNDVIYFFMIQTYHFY